MGEKKMTRKEYFERLVEVVEVAELEVEEREALVAFLAKQIAAVEKKNSSKSQTKAQKEMAELVEKIYEDFSKYEGKMTVSEYQKASEVAGAYSNQKMTAVFKKLYEAGRVNKTTEKRKSLFYIGE